jgi:hypothetical protein
LRSTSGRLAPAAIIVRARSKASSSGAGDLLGSDLGRAVVANAATQVLLRQAAQSVDAVAESSA